MHCYRFGATCKSWSAAMSKCHQVPWLVLSKHDEDTYAYSFFSLYHQEVCSLRLPELRRKRCCGSSQGWLMTIDYQTLELHLLNPFTRRQIKLPSPKTFPYPYCTETPYIGVDFIQKGILSKDPSLTDDNIVLVMFSGMGRLAFLGPGKEGKWIVMDYHKVTFQNIIYYREQFYAVDVAGALLVVEIDHQPKLTKITPCLRYHSYTWKRYLVLCSGELLHVRRPRVYDDTPYLDSSDSDNDDWNWDGFPKTYKDVDRGGVDADDDDRDCSSLNGADGDNDGDDGDDDFPIYRTGIFQSLHAGSHEQF